VLALLIWREFAESVLDPAKEDLAAPRHCRVEWVCFTRRRILRAGGCQQLVDFLRSSSAPRSTLLQRCLGGWILRDAGAKRFRFSCRGPIMPFKLHSKGRRHVPRQRHRVANWREYDATLRNRGSLTIWFTPDAIAGWNAQPRTTPGGQRHYSDLAIETALTLRAAFRLALRQSEGLIGSIMGCWRSTCPFPIIRR
jgi:hypothetical protein